MTCIGRTFCCEVEYGGCGSAATINDVGASSTSSNMPQDVLRSTSRTPSPSNDNPADVGGGQSLDRERTPTANPDNLPSVERPDPDFRRRSRLSLTSATSDVQVETSRSAEDISSSWQGSAMGSMGARYIKSMTSDTSLKSGHGMAQISALRPGSPSPDLSSSRSLESGIYQIVNCYHRNTAVMADSNEVHATSWSLDEARPCEVSIQTLHLLVLMCTHELLSGSSASEGTIDIQYSGKRESCLRIARHTQGTTRSSKVPQKLSCLR